MNAQALWRPATDLANGDHALAAFARRITAATGRTLRDYAALHAWSIAERGAFWRALWDACEVIGTPGAQAIGRDRLPGSRWFPAARLNFAENLLRRRDAGVAIVERDENGLHRETRFDELATAVLEVAAGLRAHGVGIGDRVAAIVPNRTDTIVLALATSAIGAIWSSCSPDFGTSAIVDRFTQIAPKVLIDVPGYTYAGKPFDCREKSDDVARALPTLRLRVRLGQIDDAAQAAGILPLAALRRHGALARLPRLPFSHPLYILFSSGTTGLPKCITHGAGGTLLKHLCEHRLHCDYRAGERVFFFTTCGWMMWNWLVTALASGCTLCLYDGAPFHPDPGVLPRYVQEAGIAHFGISPGYVSQLAKLDYRPREHHALRTLRSVLSTGSPLAADLFEWSYANIAPDVRLSSITGGTDIMGCFALGNPALPVYAGEIQAPALGMDIDFVDDACAPAGTGEAGELVCRAAFPSEPLGFWNDADGARYRAAYFERFPGVWHHGDFGEFTANGGIVIHGRSDATLNRGGVRIGTAEIYRQLEVFPEVLEALAISQERTNAELRIVLFVRLREGAELDADLEARIRTRLRTAASPRHVPDLILAAPDLPRTRSGKLTELAVREVIHGRKPKNVGALANPEALEWFARCEAVG